MIKVIKRSGWPPERADDPFVAGDGILRMLSLAIEQTSEAVIITNSKGTIIYANPSACHQSGYDIKEAIGRTARFARPESRNQAPYPEIWAALDRGEAWQGSLDEERRDGSSYPVIASIAPVCDQRDNVSYYICCQQDMSKYKQLERQFQQAQKMEALSTLVGGIAHDFNNMLAGMNGNLYLLKRRVQNVPDAQEKVKNIEALVQRAANMIHQLLAFARKETTNMRKLPLTPFVKESIKLLRTLVPENIRLELDFCTELLPIQADATLVHQMLANLINNAREAVVSTPDPHILIRLRPLHTDAEFVRAHPYSKEGYYACLSIKDNGRGISDDELVRIFDPFYTNKRTGDGSGLGLSMILGAIRTHEGFVTVESAVGQGSTFCLWFPLLEEPTAAAIKETKGVNTTTGQGELILIADDEMELRETTADVLEALGYRVLTARDGQDAFDIFMAQKNEIALTLLDVVMPHCNGPELATVLRKLRPDVKIIFTTGHDLGTKPTDISGPVLGKPFDIGKLSRLIRKLLET